ncbi:DUF2922 domain-containing protein [Priestia endophytica]|jgi:hypothetical protein|uniref:Uncharacterized protein n=2 Tax=Priestia endophytica TaxID=135735 RepID=A0A329F011_9BACI|nr:DUF2922 domain-containing protein [Priestia endophytica]KAB2490308.1 DUF2922 domain-containing protein [Priestia endophytica]KYG31707.1 hypothetical protein AZF06_08205 [Priestia endophytica]MBG9811436.1 hypothetical protein [Priestia endophytica]MED4073523.1 DUF2922 domain-containing protein [Priestia endophytica]RAS71825.1 hypothetical protein A3864_22330 [Priestia endophytica]
MEKTLSMQFLNESGKSVSISLQHPRENVTEDEIKAVMEELILQNIFSSQGGDFKEVKGAQIVSREVTELIV